MSNFKCSILAHSVNPVGDEAISFETCYERFIHSETMTHRWSRNASSSRAIPYKRMKEWILDDPAMPLHLGTNRPGMQSGDQVMYYKDCRSDILCMLEESVDSCDRLIERYDLHKEVVNRYTEPWGWINVVMTMGRPQLMNFFKLRCDKHAHPNMQRLAVTMARQYRASQPRRLMPGEWHLPYVTEEEKAEHDPILSWEGSANVHPLIVWSAARCAWVSYKTVDGKVATFEQAKKRHDDCVALKHVTPLEPQLRARDDHGRNGGVVAGYDCYRHMIPGESADEFDFSILDTIYKDRNFLIP